MRDLERSGFKSYLAIICGRQSFVQYFCNHFSDVFMQFMFVNIFLVLGYIRAMFEYHKHCYPLSWLFSTQLTAINKRDFGTRAH